MGRLRIHRLLIALATVMALAAPIRPAISAAAPVEAGSLRRWIRPSSRSTPRSTTRTRSERAPASSSSPGGEVLTNFHVVQGADAITAHSVGTGHDYPVDLVGYDRKHDIALVQLRGARRATDRARSATRRRLRSGTPRSALGNAGGPGSPPTHEVGAVTAARPDG